MAEQDPINPELTAAVADIKSEGPTIHKLPDPKTAIVDGDTRMYCACDKPVNTMNMPRRHTGIVPFIDNVCEGCDVDAKGLSPVICATCHRVCGRPRPEKDQFGFEIEAGRGSGLAARRISLNLMKYSG